MAVTFLGWSKVSFILSVWYMLKHQCFERSCCQFNWLHYVTICKWTLLFITRKAAAEWLSSVILVHNRQIQDSGIDSQSAGKTSRDACFPETQTHRFSPRLPPAPDWAESRRRNHGDRPQSTWSGDAGVAMTPEGRSGDINRTRDEKRGDIWGGWWQLWPKHTHTRATGVLLSECQWEWLSMWLWKLVSSRDFTVNPTVTGDVEH